MEALDVVLASQIGEGSRDAQDAVVASGGKLHVLGGLG